MIKSRFCLLLIIAVVATTRTCCAASLRASRRNNNNNNDSSRRLSLEQINSENDNQDSSRLLLFDAKTVQIKPTNDNDAPFPYDMPYTPWCVEPSEPPLDYTQCDGENKTINMIPLYGGLTNGLKFILLGAILSLENNECFFIDESNSIFPKGKIPFLNHFVEPIGLHPHSDIIQRAHSQGRAKFKYWPEVWEINHNRRIYGQLNNITSLHYQDVDGHDLKRLVLKRLWRPLPQTREAACRGLERHVGHHQEKEYITFSIRRGDKTTEGMTFATLQQYIDKAEEIFVQSQLFSSGQMPLIFVATDDCTSVPELRQLRPQWTFVSACDDEQEQEKSHGYNIFAHKHWTQEQTMHHYDKFFIELFAMASARVFIGVWYSNVSWWAYFMRPKTQEKTFFLLDTPGMNPYVPGAW